MKDLIWFYPDYKKKRCPFFSVLPGGRVIGTYVPDPEARKRAVEEFKKRHPTHRVLHGDFFGPTLVEVG